MRSILVVDDEEEILESMSRLLVAFGYEVQTCNEAGRVLDTMLKQPPNVVLHDVRMPGLDLRAQLQAIRRDSRLSHIPVILLTATLLAGNLAQEVGADGAIEKPFEPEALRKLLRLWEAGRAAKIVSGGKDPFSRN